MTATAIERLPKMISRAAAALTRATTAAEILDVIHETGAAYSAAQVARRFAKSKDAHDTIITACRKSMADALVIEARAQCRLADEYDAAQERGEVQRPGARSVNVDNGHIQRTVTEIGLTREQVRAARRIRDAERRVPGVVRRVVDERLGAGDEPTRADVRRATAPPPREVPAARRRGRRRRRRQHGEYEDITQHEGEPPPPGNFRASYIIRAEQAKEFAFYNGPFESGWKQEFARLAREVAEAWVTMALHFERNES